VGNQSQDWKTRFSPLIPSDATPEAYRGFETHADWFERINFPMAGPEFDRIPRGRRVLREAALGLLIMD